MARQKKKFNILEHELVPKHEVVPPEEAARIIRELGVRPEHLPCLRATVPLARAIGAIP